MTVADVARFLQIEEATVRRLARDGELPARKLGKHWRFLRDDLLAALRTPTAHDDTPPPGAPADGQAITQAAAAALLGVSVRTVRRMIGDGRLARVETPTGSQRVSRKSVMTAAARRP
jgi:excisionase family DNA binding protein